jgi:hypothetical protein
MQRHYLHLSVYSCDECSGPVVAGWLAMRENEISKETGIRLAGAICLTCGHRQGQATEPQRARHLLPMEWNPASPIGSDHPNTTFVETLNRSEVH